MVGLELTGSWMILINGTYIFFCGDNYLMTLLVFQLHLLLLVFAASQKAAVLSSGLVMTQGPL